MNLLHGKSLGRRKAADAPGRVLARRRFLDAGWYRPLRVALAETLPAGSALDVGCGDGYFTQALVVGGRPWVGALDISVDAVRAAAGRYKGVDWAVGDAYALPVVTRSVAVVMNVFGPVVPAEADRVLSAGGAIVAVGPGPRHLLEIRRLLQGDPEERQLRGPKGFEEHLDRFELRRITFPMPLPPGGAADLVAMTPYAHRVRPEAVLDLEARSAVTADFLIATYRRK